MASFPNCGFPCPGHPDSRTLRFNGPFSGSAEAGSAWPHRVEMDAKSLKKYGCDRHFGLRHGRRVPASRQVHQTAVLAVPPLETTNTPPFGPNENPVAFVQQMPRAARRWPLAPVGDFASFITSVAR